ncbi:MAG TPA: hypothetical protein VNI20_04895 [Fimbriimonadaceae bacterium]|nr:hypothetical protein [Fimbriimonadaceae bacterium]
MASDEPERQADEQAEPQTHQPETDGTGEKSGVPIGVIIGGILLFFCLGVAMLIMAALSSR